MIDDDVKIGLLFDEAKARNEEAFPAEVLDRILEGENKIKVFREYRNLSQDELANKTGITKERISELEDGYVSDLEKIAKALELEIDDITTCRKYDGI